jgi:hypothetical protein
MKKLLLLSVFSLFISLNLSAQKDTVSFSPVNKQIVSKGTDTNIIIYPVPVIGNEFHIKSDKEISKIRVTNIIGQDVCKFQYMEPQTFTTVPLDNPTRGMYLVSITFYDGSRIVKKIMIEGSK